MSVGTSLCCQVPLQLFNGVGERIYLFQFSVGIRPAELGKQSHSCDPSCFLHRRKAPDAAVFRFAFSVLKLISDGKAGKNPGFLTDIRMRKQKSRSLRSSQNSNRKTLMFSGDNNTG